MKLEIKIDKDYLPAIAKEMGYLEFQQLQSGEIIVNPQSKEDYVEAALENLLIGMAFKKQIEQEANDYAMTRRQNLDAEIRAKVSVKKKEVIEEPIK